MKSLHLMLDYIRSNVFTYIIYRNVSFVGVCWTLYFTMLGVEHKMFLIWYLVTINYWNCNATDVKS